MILSVTAEKVYNNPYKIEHEIPTHFRKSPTFVCEYYILRCEYDLYASIEHLKSF